MGGQMLSRRRFVKLSAVVTAGVLCPLPVTRQVFARENQSVPTRRSLPPMHYHGNKRTGCSFSAEMADMWSGGGACLPSDL